jgi:hypothetical protein
MLATGGLEMAVSVEDLRLFERGPVEPQLTDNPVKRAKLQVLRPQSGTVLAWPDAGFIHFRCEPPDRRGIS